METNKVSLARIEPETRESPVTIIYKPRSVDMYYVFDQELETLGSASIQNSLHTSLFGAGLGAALSLWVTIITITFVSPFTYAAFWAGALLSSVLTVYFGIRSVIDLIKAKKQVQYIKEKSLNREPQTEQQIKQSPSRT